jgi:LPS export ABC transporter protein LptC
MMKQTRKIWIIIVALSVVIFAAVIGIIGMQKEPEKVLLKIMSDRVDLQVRKVRYTEVGDSGMKWEILSETAMYQKKENLALFDKLTVKLVMKDGRTFVMTGDHGRLNTEKRDIEIEGNVAIISDNGDHFTTDRLRYRNSNKLIETDGPVTMDNSRVRIDGVGMIFSLSERKVTILSKVRAKASGEMRGKR